MSKTSSDKKAYSTSLRSIFTPGWDPSIGSKFTGNHSGYMVTFFRDGDTVTVNHFGSKDLGPCRPILKSETHSIIGMTSGLVSFCQENGFEWNCEDDLPEGFSLAVPA